MARHHLGQLVYWHLSKAVLHSSTKYVQRMYGEGMTINFHSRQLLYKYQEEIDGSVQ